MITTIYSRLSILSRHKYSKILQPTKVDSKISGHYRLWALKDEEEYFQAPQDGHPSRLESR